ncbi:hypothetical protein J7T55_004355 [Diaporthe amygdali]|uniref:uncharacterized protein n=1 Tax=Phomopsis amygdali TaxID=1214568 RepID=UPI0022FE7EA7|nr:uncharacterized protein J7T55_004355 [Diaporthe amygdali]KAJ0109805.1 hypothetical protein J7T55_004355 [Diaporthe amygdali]
MMTLAGTKRTAGTPYASPTKAAASAKRSRTQYDYCDEEDLESLHEDQWSADWDSGSEMSIDGDDERDSLKDRFLTSPQKRSAPSIISRQAANIQKESRNLPPAANVHRRFGSKSSERIYCVGCACISQNIAKLERQPLFDLILEKAFLMEEFHDYVSVPYIEWRAKWDRVPVSERDSGAGLFLKQELLRLGLTSREGQLVFYSFCRRDGWQETEHNWHCRICSDCMEWREWHLVRLDLIW